MSDRYIFREHDTPPPILFMEGSCIIEVPKFDRKNKSLKNKSLKNVLIKSKSDRRSGREYRLAVEAEIFLAHVKVVDGSGEMLYRFDNNGTGPDFEHSHPHELTIRLTLARNQVPVGDFYLSTANGQFLVGIPTGYKIDFKDNDNAMGDHRLRLRILEEGTNNDVEITQVHVYKDTAQGSIQMCSIVFTDLRSLGRELKVMLWMELHGDHHSKSS